MPKHTHQKPVDFLDPSRLAITSQSPHPVSPSVQAATRTMSHTSPASERVLPTPSDGSSSEESHPVESAVPTDKPSTPKESRCGSFIHRLFGEVLHFLSPRR